MTARQRIGSAAEDLAARFLADNGLRIVKRNFRCRFGEIDLIARDGDTVVFVEVRLRSSSRFGGASGSIDHIKQRKLVATAGFYLARLPSAQQCRFDAILLDRLDGSAIEWMRNAIIT
jgi:putative endonuclease